MFCTYPSLLLPRKAVWPFSVSIRSPLLYGTPGLSTGPPAGPRTRSRETPHADAGPALEPGMDITGNLLFDRALLSGAALWAFVRERRHTFLQSRVIAATNSGVLVTDASAIRSSKPIRHSGS